MHRNASKWGRIVAAGALVVVAITTGAGPASADDLVPPTSIAACNYSPTSTSVSKTGSVPISVSDAVTGGSAIVEFIVDDTNLGTLPGTVSFPNGTYFEPWEAGFAGKTVTKNIYAFDEVGTKTGSPLCSLTITYGPDAEPVLNEDSISSCSFSPSTLTVAETGAVSVTATADTSSGSAVVDTYYADVYAGTFGTPRAFGTGAFSQTWISAFAGMTVRNDFHAYDANGSRVGDALCSLTVTYGPDLPADPEPEPQAPDQEESTEVPELASTGAERAVMNALVPLSAALLLLGTALLVLRRATRARA